MAIVDMSVYTHFLQPRPELHTNYVQHKALPSTVYPQGQSPGTQKKELHFWMTCRKPFSQC